MNARELLEAYVKAHNEGERTGDFRALVGLMHPDAELRFKGPRVGPFVGRTAIARAFDEDPPGASLRLLGVEASGRTAEAPYGWVGAAAVVAGTLHLEEEGGKIRRLEVRVITGGRDP